MESKITKCFILITVIVLKKNNQNFKITGECNYGSDFIAAIEQDNLFVFSHIQKKSISRFKSDK